VLIDFVDGAIEALWLWLWLIAARTSKELHNVNMNRKPCASIVQS